MAAHTTRADSPVLAQVEAFFAEQLKRPIVIEFAGTAITEATGWRAMLRDKNVPLV